MRYFRTEDNTGFKYIHSKDDKVIYIENETAEAPQFSLQYGDKLIQIFVTNDEYRPERDIVGTPDLFTLSYRSDMNDKGQYILATEAEINIYEDDFFNIDELKTVGETDILIKYFEHEELVWQGFALPDFFQTGIAKPRVLRIVATDRIGVLKDIENTSVSNTPKEIIEECLLQTGLTLPLEIRSIDNYLTSTTIERERIEGISAYDVIRAFMVQFNSKIVQYKNKWWIVNKKTLEDGFSDQEIIDIDLVYLDGQREIKPTASEVSLFLEFGGSKRYPENALFREWDGSKFVGWESKGGQIQRLNYKSIIDYTQSGLGTFNANFGEGGTTPSLYCRYKMLSYNFENEGNYFNNQNGVLSNTFPVKYRDGDTEVTLKIDFTTVSANVYLPFVLIMKAPDGKFYAIDRNGIVVNAYKEIEGTFEVDLTEVDPIRVFPVESNYLDAVQSLFEETFTINQSELGITSESAQLQFMVYSVGYRVPDLGSSSAYLDVLFNSIQVIFNKSDVTGKGLIFKTKQGGDKFSKVRETETTLFSDKINQGVNGYFYNYKYDDTSITNLPKEYLLAMTRQMADMFCSARDFYSFGGKFKVNPLARYKCGSKYFVFVGGASHRENSEIDIEEIVSNPNLTRTDYIYTYFEDSKDNVKSIGTASGGGGAGGGSGGGGVDANSHNHPNKEVLDTITQEMLDNALREMLGVDSLEEATDENFFSALRTLAEIIKNNESLKALFLSKVDDDTAQGLIKFVKGLEIGNYTTGLLGGGGAFKMINGISHLEVDKLDVRMIATFFELVISKLRHIGGQFILTPASMKCIEVEVVANGYKCFFDRGDNNEVVQEFVVNDQARCQVFSGSGLKMYWRLVVEVGDDYIVLSDTDKLEGSSTPEVGDDIVQLGYRGIDKPERTSAMVLSTVGIDAPSFKQYKGIVTYTLEGKETTALTGTGNRLAGDTIFIQDKSLDTVLEEIERANKAPIIRDGYWYEWNPDSTEEDKYEPTGVRAEGVKGDGAIEKFKSSATQPPTPTGEAEDWDDEPTQNQEILLEPIGNNLYDRNYLLARGWVDDAFMVYKMDAGSGEIVVPSTKFKDNKQYRVQGTFDGGGLGSTLRINYSSGLPWEKLSQYDYSVNEITDKNRTVQSITISYGNASINNNFTVFELLESGTKNLPIWVSRKRIINGVESAWSTPVRWSGEDGEKGKDGTGINVVGSADTWNSLPTSGNNLNDARIVQDTGVLAVWDGTKWVEAGEIKGPAGDTPYIGGNGNWWIGSTDTGVPARGPEGSGRGIISIREQFYIHTSGTIPPSTTWTWLDSMPKKTEADEGKFLWIRIKTIFTDDSTPDYSSPRVYEEWGIKDYVEKSAYLLEALREHPKVTTGLLLSKVIGMFDINDDVTAYMNGNPTLNPNAFASGVKNFGEQGLETAKAVIRHDGSVKFTDGDIGGVKISPDGFGEFESYGDLPIGTFIQITTSGVKVIKKEHPYGQLPKVTRTELFDGVIKVSEDIVGQGILNTIEIRPDGIYKNGIKIL